LTFGNTGIVWITDLLYLLENTFDRKYISANPSPNFNPNSSRNPKV